MEPSRPQVGTLKVVELCGSQPSLPHYAAQDAHRYLSVTRNNRCEYPFVTLFDKLDVAAPLTGFNEA